MQRFLGSILLSLALVIGGTAGVAAEKRVALIIGNDDYRTLPDLDNAGKDARGMAAKLEALGFQVVLKLNAGRRVIGRALADFEARLAGADVGLMFFAGHGIQAGGRNYLIPADAVVEVEEDLRYEGVDSADFLETMGLSGSPLNIVILDACRDNPLPRRTRSAARGLAVVAVPKDIQGTAILYSAAPGQTAQDGPKGGHGVFTGELLEALDEPGLKLEDVFKRTAAAVAERTKGKQDPWFHSSVKGDFIFRRAKRVAKPAKSAPDTNMEALFWQSIKDSTNPAMFEAYLAQYPKGTFAPLARVKIDELGGREVARLPEPSSPAGPTPDMIRQAQRLLSELGYDPGPVDGRMGRNTRRAIGGFQRSNGLAEDGAVSDALLSALKVARQQVAAVRPPPRAAKRIVDFEDLDTSSKPVWGARLSGYLARFGITLTDVERPENTVFVNTDRRDQSALASSGSNFLDQASGGGTARSYTLRFHTPLDSLRFTRTAFYQDFPQ